MTWPTKKIGEVCEIEYGTRIVKLRNTPGQYYVYGGGGKTFTTDTYNRENRVIISRFGMSPNCVRKVHGKFYLNDSGLTLAPQNHKEFVQDYLDLFLFSVEQEIYNLGRGQAQRNLNIVEFKNLEVPLPPIDEQKRVVKKIEKLFAKIGRASRLRAESSAASAVLLPSALHQIFSRSGKEGWAIKKVGEICEKPQYGYTASARQEKVGPKLLRITDIQNGLVEWKNVPYCKCNDAKKYELESGDIVFARTGATVGKSFLIKSVPEKSIFASYLIRLHAKESVVPKYLYAFFQSPDYWQQIAGHQVGAAQPNVNASKLSEIKIPLPPKAEQKKIVAYLDALSRKSHELQALQSQTAADFSALRQSILSRAFNGKL